MKRWHLFEIQDFSWCPSTVRNGITEVLRTLVEISSLSDFLADRIEETIRSTSQDTVIDLCSGAGGPALTIAEILQDRGNDLEWVLSDRYPNESAEELVSSRDIPGVRYEPRSIDALGVELSDNGLRTMFNSLHHFQPEAVKQILRDAARSANPFLAVELPGRDFTNYLPLALTPVLALGVRPFIRPVRWSHWALTYLIPIIPLVLLWDSLVSGLRAYSVEELEAITSEVDGMNWEVGQWQPDATLQGPITYVLGMPESTSANEAS